MFIQNFRKMKTSTKKKQKREHGEEKKKTGT